MVWDSSRILAIDIGGGTQDILIYEEEREPENYSKLVLPSPTSIIAAKIRRATQSGKNIHLSGGIMGGGSCVRAIRNHLKAGYRVTSEQEAAKTIKDDLRKVTEMGITITGEAPPGSVVLDMKDVDTKTLQHALEPFDIKLPPVTAVAVQDHGEAPAGTSNRYFRFQHWKTFLEEGGDITGLVYSSPPPYLTRMKAAQKAVPRSIVMDTCAAALWGGLSDSLVKEKHPYGIVLVNIGNQHTFAALLKDFRVYGLAEHHTRFMDSSRLCSLVERLRNGNLTHEEVYNDGGHGCCIVKNDLKGFQFVAVAGPRRGLAMGLGYHFINPHGDMMMTGCHGLVEALKNTGM